jgi:hypothetical protein
LTNFYRIDIFPSGIRGGGDENISSFGEDEAGCSSALVSEGNIRKT